MASKRLALLSAAAMAVLPVAPACAQVQVQVQTQAQTRSAAARPVCDGLVDDTARLQALADAGGLVQLPAGTCVYTTLRLTKPIRLVGALNNRTDPATELRSTAANGADKIVVGGGPEQVDGVLLQHLVLTAPRATGGAVVFFDNAADSGVEDAQMLALGASAYGVKAFRINDLHLSNLRIVAPVSAGLYAYGGDKSRSDVFVLNNVIVSGDSLSGRTRLPNCIDLDGFVNTLDGQQVLCVAAGRGLYAHNSVGSTQRAEYVMLQDMEVDYPYYEAVRIDWHDGVNFVNSYFHGSITTDNIVVSARSPQTTTNLSFIGGQCTGAHGRCAYLDGRYTRMIGMLVAGNSLGAKGARPGVEIGPDARDTLLEGDVIGQESGLVGPSHGWGVQIDRGAADYLVRDNDLKGNVLGAVKDEAGAAANSAGQVGDNLGTVAPESMASLAPANGFDLRIGPGPGAYDVASLALFPAGPLAIGTLRLPTRAAPGQSLTVFSSQPIAALEVAPASGDTITGAPHAMAADSAFRLRYDQANHVWMRVQ